MALFRAKFAWILAISNSVFRWESCKGSVWKSVKNCSRLCKEIGTRGWISGVTRGLQVARMLHMCQACQKLKSRASYYTTGQKSQAGQAIFSQLELITQPSREVKSPERPVWEKLTFHIPSHPTIYIPLYPWFWESFQRKFWERNPREKQDWLIHNLYLRDSSNSSTLQIPQLSSSPLSNPLEVYYQNIFSPYPFLWEGCLVLWEAVRKEPISHWLMLWSSSRIREARKEIGSA